MWGQSLPENKPWDTLLLDLMTLEDGAKPVVMKDVLFGPRYTVDIMLHWVEMMKLRTPTNKKHNPWVLIVAGDWLMDLTTLERIERRAIRVEYFFK